MLDMDMLFPERAAHSQKDTSVSPAQMQVGRPDSVSLNDLMRRVEILETEVRLLKDTIKGREKVQSPKEQTLSIPLVEQQLYARALRHFTSGEYGKASELLRQVRENTTDQELNLSALYWLGECAFRLKNYNETVVLLQELLSEESDQFRENALILVAVSFRNLGKDGESIRYYKAYLNAFPDSKYSAFARRELEKNQ